MDKFMEFIIFFSGTSFGGVLGYLLKTQIDHRLSVARNFQVIEANEFNKAAAAFRVAFIEQIYFLRKSIESKDCMAVNIITPEVLTFHEKAKILFEPYVPSISLRAFTEAWEKYKQTEDVYTEELTPKRSNLKSYKVDLCQYYLDHINDLLKFAEPKLS